MAPRRRRARCAGDSDLGTLLIGEEPEYSFLAARLLAEFIQEEVREQGITTFSQGIFQGARARHYQ